MAVYYFDHQYDNGRVNPLTTTVMDNYHMHNYNNMSPNMPSANCYRSKFFCRNFSIFSPPVHQ